MFDNSSQINFAIINYEDYNNNLISYKSNFSTLLISLKIFAVLTPFLSNSFIMFIINSINIILFDIINLTINLPYTFIVEIKEINVILKKRFNSNKKTHVKNEKPNSSSRKQNKQSKSRPQFQS